MKNIELIKEAARAISLLESELRQAQEDMEAISKKIDKTINDIKETQAKMSGLIGVCVDMEKDDNKETKNNQQSGKTEPLTLLVLLG